MKTYEKEEPKDERYKHLDELKAYFPEDIADSLDHLKNHLNVE